jgi:hypothetical protein
VRQALTPLADLAAETDAAIVILRHLTKSRGTSALTAGAGSMGLIGVARSALMVDEDPDDPTRRLLASPKNNNGPCAPTLRFALESVDLGPPEGRPADAHIVTSRIRWEGQSNLSADDINAASRDEDQRNRTREAQDFLRIALAHGPREKKEVVAEAAQQEIKQRTLERAFKVLGGVASERQGFRGHVEWTLPIPPSLASPAYTWRVGETEGSSLTQPVVPQERLQSRQAPTFERVKAPAGETGETGELRPGEEETRW